MKSRLLGLLIMVFVVGVASSCKDGLGIDRKITEIDKELEEQKKKGKEIEEKHRKDREKEERVKRQKEETAQKVIDRISGKAAFDGDLLEVIFMNEKIVSGNPSVLLTRFYDNSGYYKMDMRNIFPSVPEFTLTASVSRGSIPGTYFISAGNLGFSVEAWVTEERGMEMKIVKNNLLGGSLSN